MRLLALLFPVLLCGCAMLQQMHEEECFRNNRGDEPATVLCLGYYDSPRVTRLDVQCARKVQHAEFESVDDCKFADDKPELWSCLQVAEDKKAKARCRWVDSHPIEAECEEDAHGDYWGCVRAGREREQLTDMREEAREAREEAAEERAEDRRREAIRDVGKAFSDYGKAMQPKPTTHCVSQRDFSGQLVTDCQ